MPTVTDPSHEPDALALLLPGSWHVRATNFPMWLAGDRLDPVFSYTIARPSPLVLTDDVSYRTAEGGTRHIRGTDRLREGEFLWRGRLLLWFIRSRWSVIGSSADGNIVVLRFGASRLTPAGIDVLVRVGADIPEPRATVAATAAQLGLTLEDFGTLSWLEPAEPAPAADPA